MNTNMLSSSPANDMATAENGGGKGGREGEKEGGKGKKGEGRGKILIPGFRLLKRGENNVCDKYLIIYLEKGKDS
jgi:hypothetical protein